MLPLILTGAALGASAIGSLGSFWGSQKAADLERVQADLIRKETDERVRRFDAESRQRLGLATAAGAASGVEFQSSSLQKYLSDMGNEFKKQSDWMKQAGYEQARYIDQGADSKDAASYFNTLSDFGSAVTRFGADNNWFKTS